MKKRYTAPDIVFESFSLSVSIAACQFGTNQTEGSCGYKWDAETIIFAKGVDACDFEIEDGSDKYNGICYDVPSEGKEIFNS